MQIGYPVPNFPPAHSDPCFCLSGEIFGQCCGSKAADRKLPGGVQVFSGFVDADTCRKWVARLERQPRERAIVTDVNRSPNRAPVGHADPGRVCDDVTPGVLRKQINDQVMQGFIRAARITGRTLEWFETPRGKSPVRTALCRCQQGGIYRQSQGFCGASPRGHSLPAIIGVMSF